MIAFGAYRLPLPEDASHDDRSQRAKDMLARVLHIGNAVAVVGSGCTVSRGYPVWKVFAREALEAVMEALRTSDPGLPGRLRYLEELEGYARQLGTKTKKPVTAESLMFYLGACQRIAGTAGFAENPFFRYVEKRFRRARGRAPRGSPTDLLAELPIHRFVTTNYDCEIERSLCRVRPGLKAESERARFRLKDLARSKVEDERSLSFTQTARWSRHQIRFALARELRDHAMVFHCHGRFDEAESIIASEKDYQDWYVSRAEPGGPGFLQNMEILFGSNPLLFVGYGLNEYDLMQILRQVGAGDPERKHARPIFAVLPDDGSHASRHHHAALYERYGIHVIPYHDLKKDRTTALCKALEEIRLHWLRARDEWYEKPFVRRPAAPRSRVLQIPKFTKRATFGLDRVPVTDRSDEIWRAVTGESRVVGVVGSSGTGKTWHALKLVRRALDGDDFRRIFYWNAHYTNEAITAFDILIEHLGGDRATGISRHQALFAALTAGRHLVIVDGFERLLRPADGPGQGRAYGPVVRGLLRAAATADFESRIVLVGRLWPSELGQPSVSDLAVDEPREDAPLPGVREDGVAGARERRRGPRAIVLERVRAADLERWSAFEEISPADRTALASLLAGHSYGLRLAGASLLRAAQAARGSHRKKVEAKRKRLDELRRLLARKPPQKRLDALIADTLEKVGQGKRGGLGPALLAKLSFFQEPVSPSTLEIVFDEARAERGESGPPGPDELSDLLKELVRYRLAVAVEDRSSDGPAYVCHPTIRHFLRNRRRSSQSVASDFSLSSFTRATLGVDPGSSDRRVHFDRLFRRLCDESAERSRRSGKKLEPRRLCRDAFGMLRSEMECSAAVRWPEHDYDSYLRYIISLASLVKELSPKHRWCFCDPRSLPSLETDRATLYVGELAWLYNEVALALFAEGKLQDAFAVWEQSYEINRVLENTEPYGEYAVESLLNLTHVLLELGKIVDSVEYLEKAERLNLGLGDEDIRGRICGFRGFYEHLRGNLHHADTLYAAGLRLLEGGYQGWANPRALSFFSTLRAQAEIQLGEIAKAAALIARSEAYAAAGPYRDLDAYVRIAEGDLRSAGPEPELHRARLAYGKALQSAEAMGARSLQALAHLKLGELSLCQGDAEGARFSTLRSLKIANDEALELVATRALITLGRAMIRLGQRDLGTGYLEVAKQRARTQQYDLRQREAEERLHEEGVSRRTHAAAG